MSSVGWTLTEPVSGLTVAVVPGAGDVKVVADYQTTVLYALRGTSPYVSDGPQRAATITIPELMFTDMGALGTLRAIRDLSRRVILTDDLGNSYPARFVGGLSERTLDTPNRATFPVVGVTVTLVGVA